MKKAFFILLMVSLVYKGYSQDIIKYKTIFYSFKDVSGDGPYEWTERKPVSVLVVMAAKRTTIYTGIEQNYDFVEETTSHYQIENSIDTAWKAIDQKGMPCILQLHVYKGHTILFIFYDYVHIFYDLMTIKS
ncbi:MAG TPA: hypothetical protein VIK55_15495 [Paludibacter sp.]